MSAGFSKPGGPSYGNSGMLQEVQALGFKKLLSGLAGVYCGAPVACNLEIYTELLGILNAPCNGS